MAYPLPTSGYNLTKWTKTYYWNRTNCTTIVKNKIQTHQQIHEMNKIKTISLTTKVQYFNKTIGGLNTNIDNGNVWFWGNNQKSEYIGDYIIFWTYHLKQME